MEPTTLTTADTLIPIRTYRFQYGVLHLERATAESLTDEGIMEEYSLAGPLLEKWDDEMGEEEFYNLPDFNDL